MSLPSYMEYPTHRPFINSLLHRHTPQTHTHQSSRRPPSPSKAFPETSSAAILSGLKNLQEKIRRLELEKGQAQLSLHASHARQRNLNDQTDTERATNGRSDCNQVLVSHLAAAESRCVKLERQLDHMRKMLRNAKADQTALLKQQVSLETARSADQRQCGVVSERAQLEKLERLEQEYLRLTHTQNKAEVKIRELEMKLEEEEHQRKLVQDKANQLQTGLEANRRLLQSVSPGVSKEKKSNTKKSSAQHPSFTEPHYRLSLRDVPFVAGTSAGCSHSVRANVQSVLSLLKRHQPQLCNSRVLSADSSCQTSHHGRSDASSSSSPSCSSIGEELSELLHALQEELRLMSIEQEELARRAESSATDQERQGVQREQERLLLNMERKGEQITKLYKHRAQIKKLRREALCRRGGGKEAKGTPVVSTRGRSSAGAVKVRPGERSKRNLRLLRDMRALQSSLRT